MSDLFELEWFGGAVERRFRGLRSGVAELPWGSFEREKYPPLLLERARAHWTRSALGEYRAACAFSELTQAMLLARVPVDLVAVVSDFVTDELSHVELASRLAAELGGPTPVRADLRTFKHQNVAGLSELQQCNEQVIELCCIELFNIQMLSRSLRVCEQPLIHAILKKILQDEAPHGHFGWHYLNWAEPHLSDAERQRLAGVALRALRELAVSFRRLISTASEGVTREGFLVQHIHELGWLEAQDYLSDAHRVLHDSVAAPLAEHGIHLTPSDVDALFEREPQAGTPSPRL